MGERQKYLINASHTKRLSGDYDKEISMMQHSNKLRKERAQKTLAQAEERREEQRIRLEAQAAATLRPPRPKAKAKASCKGRATVPMEFSLHTASRANSRPSSAPATRDVARSIAARDAVRGLYVELEALAKMKEESLCKLNDQQKETEALSKDAIDQTEMQKKMPFDDDRDDPRGPIQTNTGEPEEEAPSREDANTTFSSKSEKNKFACDAVGEEVPLACTKKEPDKAYVESLRSKLLSLKGDSAWSGWARLRDGDYDLDMFIAAIRQDDWISVRQFGEDELQNVFEAIDAYATGWINVGEFTRWLGIDEDSGPQPAESVGKVVSPIIQGVSSSRPSSATNGNATGLRQLQGSPPTTPACAPASSTSQQQPSPSTPYGVVDVPSSPAGVGTGTDDQKVDIVAVKSPLAASAAPLPTTPAAAKMQNEDDYGDEFEDDYGDEFEDDGETDKEELVDDMQKSEDESESNENIDQSNSKITAEAGSIATTIKILPKPAPLPPKPLQSSSDHGENFEDDGDEPEYEDSFEKSSSQDATPAKAPAAEPPLSPASSGDDMSEGSGKESAKSSPRSASSKD